MAFELRFEIAMTTLWPHSIISKLRHFQTVKYLNNTVISTVINISAVITISTVLGISNVINRSAHMITARIVSCLVSYTWPHTNNKIYAHTAPFTAVLHYCYFHNSKIIYSTGSLYRSYSNTIFMCLPRICSYVTVHQFISTWMYACSSCGIWSNSNFSVFMLYTHFARFEE